MDPADAFLNMSFKFGDDSIVTIGVTDGCSFQWNTLSGRLIGFKVQQTYDPTDTGSFPTVRQI